VEEAALVRPRTADGWRSFTACAGWPADKPGDERHQGRRPDPKTLLHLARPGRRQEVASHLHPQKVAQGRTAELARHWIVAINSRWRKPLPAIRKALPYRRRFSLRLCPRDHGGCHRRQTDLV
jgi:hypothetical protein